MATIIEKNKKRFEKNKKIILNIYGNLVHFADGILIEGKREIMALLP